MNRANRAAQFQPFDALKGLREALQAKEEKCARVNKRELSEERKQEISDTLCKLERCRAVELVFYYQGKYIDICGAITAMNPVYKYISIDEMKIFFDDIYSIDIID